MNVAVVGAGVFGRNHARVYHELSQQDPSIKLTAVVDSDPAQAQAVAQKYGATAYSSLKDLFYNEKIHAASVAVPTIHHLDIASQLMESGIDVLIEKPLASSIEEADQLIAIARKAGRIGQVGHLERFNPAVRATLPLITQPMFFEVHRLSVFTPRSLDVDVVLDLMIHDLDIILAFVNSPVKEIRAVGLPILSGKVDIANVRMEFDSGCVANLTASRVSTERVRKLRFFQPAQYISIDYSRQDVIVFSVGAAAAPSATPSVNPQISMAKPPVTAEEPLHAELKSFLECVRERTKPLVSLDDGRRALSVALEIVSAIQSHSREFQLERLRFS